MTQKSLPIEESVLLELAERFPTPFHVYSEQGIRENARRLIKAFDWNSGFREYFAVKATPNPHLMSVLADEGIGADCSSLAELVLAEAVGIGGEGIMFTSNNTPVKEYRKASQLGAVLNLDDFTHIDFVAEEIGMPELICFRYNPGPLRADEGNVIIGKPEESKYGFTRQQLNDGYQRVREMGAKRFGLHTMVASNELNPEFFIETARMLFEIAVELAEQFDIRLEFVNLGGGIGVAMQPDQVPVDYEKVSAGVQTLYRELIEPAGLHPLKVLMENGRVMTGPFGVLVTKAIHHKHIYKNYVGVDACMVNLMRPGMYGAYHHISVLGKQSEPHDQVYDVVGSLCENNDKFAIDRMLPKIAVGDVLVIHDTGAHGHAMGFQYNGKLRSAEYLLKEDGSVQEIRRAETLDDYFGTLDFPGL